ncbi:MAG: hypothetical protein QGG40_08990, partial [Myxococcota bacterium]|nr:hypothetical protein [Myxococcota bacterium]
MAAALVAPLLVMACGADPDPLAELDARYTAIMVDVGVSSRDTAKNVRNKEARRRKVEAEQARVSFFSDKGVQRAIEEARQAEPGTWLREKADAYWRHLILARSWTPDEKRDEARLLGRLEEERTVEGSWLSPDGETEVSLNRGWGSVSREVEETTDEIRAALAQSFIEHRMRVVGTDLQDLVRLRNKVAKREGFSNYWELALAAEGLTPEDVDKVIEDLWEVVRPVNEQIQSHITEISGRTELTDTFANRPLLRRLAGMDQGISAAEDYFDADLAEDRIMTAFQDMGIETEGWQVYSGPQRYVRPGAYSFPIRPPEFVAIVMSKDRRWGMWQYRALAHEGGLAVWWKALDAERAASPVLWDPTAPWFEGMGQFFERILHEPSFLARYVPELPDELRVTISDWRTRRIATWVTSSIIQTLVERRLYEDPSNLEAITRFAAETRSHYTGAPLGPQLESGLHYDSSLLSSILWNYPAYSQNYLFAYMTEAWLYEAVAAQVGDPVANKDVGPLLRDKIIRVQPGISFPERIAALLPG